MRLYGVKYPTGTTGRVETLKQGEYAWAVVFRRQIKLSESDSVVGEWRVADFATDTDQAKRKAESLKANHRLPGYRIQTAVVEAWPVREMDSAK